MINFTPWRIRQRQHRQRRFLSYAGLSVALSLLISGSMAWYWHQQTKKLQQQELQIMNEQQTLQPQVEYVTQLKQAITDHQNAQQMTLGRRQQAQQYYQTLMKLAQHWPLAVRLTSARFYKQTYQLHGFADSANALTELIEQLKQLSYVKHIEFTDWQFIKTTQGKFILQIQLVETNDAQLLE